MSAEVAPKPNLEGRVRFLAALRSLPRPTGRMSKIPFLLVLAVIMGVGMAGVLLLNTQLQNQAFEVRSSQQLATELGYQVADLESQANQARSPGQLAIKAQQLGMRPNTHPVYVTFPDGKIVGRRVKVKGSEIPEMLYKTPEQVKAEEAARAADDAERSRVKIEALKAREKARIEAQQDRQAEQDAREQKTKADEQAKQKKRTG